MSLGLYVVGMFDTGQAMRVLRKGRLSLAYLVSYYCQYNLDKQYQLADWRIRPLPVELLKYAREDTHYLLHCYDKLCNEMIDRARDGKLINTVFTESAHLALQLYEKPLYSDTDCNKLLSKAKMKPNSRQLFALRQLFAWRDKSARLHDESIRYTLPDHMLLQIADVLPREMQGIIACCNPVPQLVREELLQLHQIILQARDRPIEEKLESLDCVVYAKRDRDPMLTAVHDFSHVHDSEEIHNRIPVVSGKYCVELKSQPSLLAFCDVVHKKVNKKVTSVNRILRDWASPFERYLLAMQERERRNREKSEDIKVSTGPKRFSHHDPPAERAEPEIEIESVDPFARLSAGSKADECDEPIPPPKISKKRKKDRNAYMMPLAAVVGEEEESGDVLGYSPPKKGRIVHNTDTGTPIDYANMDATIFEKRGAGPSTGEGVFDPFKKLNEGKGKKGGRKMKMRGGKKSMSFGNQE